MGIISNIIENNRHRDQMIAEIEESTQKEIDSIQAYYAEKEKQLQDHHNKFMQKLDDPNLTPDQIMSLLSEYEKAI